MKKNNMLERWVRWEPIEGLSFKYFIKEIIDNPNLFKIVLKPLNSEQKSIEVLFENGVRVYRRTDESFRAKLVHDLDEKYKVDFYKNWTFFKVENSEYFFWISDQSYEWSDVHSFIHFSLIASNAVVDVLADYEPVVKFID